MSRLEDLAGIYSGRRVLLTGHTGFKGSWLSLWLHKLGAEVLGISLEPPSKPCLFESAAIKDIIDGRCVDIRQAEILQQVFAEFDPEFVFHLAAQSLVRLSYKFPLDTMSVNIMGTANVLDACRYSPSTRSVIIVTSDKCYRNNEWVWGYRENDPVGGHDPYSASKGCAELVTSSYTASFFPEQKYGISHQVAVASARAGNVIGGGDWAEDRLVPDCIRALLEGNSIILRSPDAIRPWQHVLEPIYGYLLLGARLHADGPAFSGGWNFAPLDRADIWPVERVVKYICNLWGGGSYTVDSEEKPHEAGLLSLDAIKACMRLGWRPCWRVADALDKTVEWYRFWYHAPEPVAIREMMSRQIDNYLASSQAVTA